MPSGTAAPLELKTDATESVAPALESVSLVNTFPVVRDVPSVVLNESSTATGRLGR